MKNINFKSGTFRLWMVLSISWLLLSLTQNYDSISYASRYTFNKNILEQSSRANIEAQKSSLILEKSEITNAETKDRKDLEAKLSEFSRKENGSSSSLLLPTKQNKRILEINEKIKDLESASLTPEEPQWDWVFHAVLPPIIFPLLVLFVFYVFRWVISGFSKKKV